MKKSVFYISITVIVCILTFTTNIPDLDLWARLAVGSIFFHTSQVLKHDIFSYLPTKDLWVDHEWGSGVVFYFLVNHFGALGLFALKAFIILAIFILFIKIIKLQTNQDTAGIFYFIFLGFSLLPGIANLLRCQMFTYLFFTLWIYILEKLRRHDNRFIWAFPVTTLLWVNMHGGFLAGIGLVAIYAIGEFLNRKNYLKYVGVLALIISVTLINPYGLKFWSYIIDASLMTRPGILEWAPISLNGPFHIIKGFKIHVYTGFFIFTLLTFLVGIRLYLQKVSPDWTRIILVVLLLYLGIKRQRHTEFFLLAVPALFYHHYVKLLFEPLQKIIKNHLSEKLHNGWTSVRYSFGYIFLTVIFIFMIPKLSGRIFVDPTVYPVGSLAFIKQNNISGNLATTFGWGSYAFWKLYPQCKVLIDGRYEEAYPNDLYDSAMQFSENKGDVQEIIKKYKTDILILSKRKYAPSDLLNFTDWKPVYEDLSSVLLLPKDKVKPFYIYPDYKNPIYYKEDLSRIIY